MLFVIPIKLTTSNEDSAAMARDWAKVDAIAELAKYIGSNKGLGLTRIDKNTDHTYKPNDSPTQPRGSDFYENYVFGDAPEDGEEVGVHIGVQCSISNTAVTFRIGTTTEISEPIVDSGGNGSTEKPISIANYFQFTWLGIAGQTGSKYWYNTSGELAIFANSVCGMLMSGQKLNNYTDWQIGFLNGGVFKPNTSTIYTYDGLIRYLTYMTNLTLDYEDHWFDVFAEESIYRNNILVSPAMLSVNSNRLIGDVDTQLDRYVMMYQGSGVKDGDIIESTSGAQYLAYRSNLYLIND